MADEIADGTEEGRENMPAAIPAGSPADDPLGAVRVHPEDDPERWDARRVMFVSTRTARPWWATVGEPFGLATMSHEDVRDWQPQSLADLAAVLGHSEPSVDTEIERLRATNASLLAMLERMETLHVTWHGPGGEEFHPEWCRECRVDKVRDEALEKLRKQLLDWAEVLTRGGGMVVPADIAWKLRQLAARPVGSDTDDAARKPSDAAVDNAVAGALRDQYGFLPLGVRYEAAVAARRVVERWTAKPLDTTSTPEQILYCGATEGYTGVDCQLEADHGRQPHEGRYIDPNNEGNWLFVRWPVSSDRRAATTRGIWRAGDLALDRTDFVWWRDQHGWRPIARCMGPWMSDRDLGRFAGPLMRLAGLPAEMCKVGSVPAEAAARLRGDTE